MRDLKADRAIERIKWIEGSCREARAAARSANAEELRDHIVDMRAWLGAVERYCEHLEEQAEQRRIREGK